MPELVTIQDVYEALKRIEEKMATREDVEALIDSVEILNNPKTMEALRKSDQDIESNRVVLKKLLPSKSCLTSC